MRAWTHPAYEAVAQLVTARTGLAFHGNSCSAAEIGTRRAMQRAGVSDLVCYTDLLRSREAAFADLLDELTVRETYFFRHPGRFEFIRRHVLPEIRRRRGPEHVVRAWSAGCASGEEAYSLAIMFDQEGLADRSFILGTDISQAALRVATEGAYGASSLRGVPDALIRRYFHRRGYQEVVEDRIRARVLFRCSNLAADPQEEKEIPSHHMDLILCRNVLIYFDPESVKRVARRLFDSLAEGGWLVTGASDPPLTVGAPFITVCADQGVVYRRSLHSVSVIEAHDGRLRSPPHGARDLALRWPPACAG